MRTITTIEEIMEIISDCHNFGYYGLRMATEHDLDLLANAEEGEEYLDRSYDMSDDSKYLDECDFLEGTCSIGINDYMSDAEIAKMLNVVKEYSGSTILLIAGKNSEYGNDPHEEIIWNSGLGAYVIGIVNIA